MSGCIDMSGDANFPAAADELRRQEFSRLSAAVTPRIEAFRSMTADAFRTEIALMLERLGHTVVSSVSDIVTTKNGRKYVTACATPTDQAPTKTPRPPCVVVEKPHAPAAASSNAETRYWVLGEIFRRRCGHAKSPAHAHHRWKSDVRLTPAEVP
jgi:hypothetical protein